MTGARRVAALELSKSGRYGMLVALLGVAAGCGAGHDYQQHGGPIMGTRYQVTARCPVAVDGMVRGELEAVNAEMSTYLEDSVIARFNRAEPGRWVDVPPAVVEVLAASLALGRASSGAFDVTVGPLVNLWGFGPPDAPEPPDDQAITSALRRVDFRQLEVRRDPPAVRKNAPVTVDLSAIAKGHGTDRVAERLRAAGCNDYLVDVGGEVRVQGRNPSGKLWRVGVEVPDPGRLGAVQRVLTLESGALATSGDYRNYITVNGQRLSHTIDPRTGRPVAHALASVTVVHDSAMWADGYATLINVLGPEAGLAFAREARLPVLLIVRTAGGYEERYNDLMRNILQGSGR